MASVNNNTNNTQLAYSYLQSKNKIGGLVSGMDIDSIMEKLMKAESAQMEKLQQQKQKYEWKRDAYREVNTKLDTFQQNLFDNYSLKSSWNTKSANVSSNSAVSVKANTNASGNLTISNVKVATNATSNFNSQVTDSSKTVEDILGTSAEDGKFTLRAVQEDGSTKDTTISYSKTDTIDSLISKINNSGSGVTAILHAGQLSFSANNMGERKGEASLAEISLLSTYSNSDNTTSNISDSTKQLFSSILGESIDTFNNGEYTLANGGSNASITVNGVSYNQNSNVFNVAGYEIIATKNFTASSASDNIAISSTSDTDKAVDKVKEFVTMYNDLLKELNTKTTEKKKVGYEPLTDAQKAEMTTSEIEKWEAAAKEGLLKGDTTLNTVLSSMRQTLFNYGNSVGVKDFIGNKGETLASIGITTSSTWSENGKLEIDEEKLRAAIEKDPDIVSRIFTGDGTDQNPGIVSNLRKAAQTAVKTIEKSAGKESAVENQYSLGKSIISLTTKISDWKERLKDIEDRYWKQFSAMETAIQKANSQSSIFSA